MFAGYQMAKRTHKPLSVGSLQCSATTTLRSLGFPAHHRYSFLVLAAPHFRSYREFIFSNVSFFPTFLLFSKVPTRPQEYIQLQALWLRLLNEFDMEIDSAYVLPSTTYTIHSVMCVSTVLASSLAGQPRGFNMKAQDDCTGLIEM